MKLHTYLLHIYIYKGPLAVTGLPALHPPGEDRLGASEHPAAGGGSGSSVGGRGAHQGVQQRIVEINCEGHYLKGQVKHTLKEAQKVYL